MVRHHPLFAPGDCLLIRELLFKIANQVLINEVSLLLKEVLTHAQDLKSLFPLSYRALWLWLTSKAEAAVDCHRLDKHVEDRFAMS